MVGRRGWICLWPGLAPLWLRGVAWCLAIAVLFALLLDFTLVVSFIWTETIPTQARNLLWLALGLSWAVAVIVSLPWARGHQAPAEESHLDQRLRQAQCEYLRGNWVDAELTLLKLLGQRADDADVRLMLASLYRHCGRLREAEAELRYLERFESAVKWRWEIAQERQLLAERADRQRRLAEPVGPLEQIGQPMQAAAA